MKRLGVVLTVISAVTILLCGTALVYSAPQPSYPTGIIRQPITADGVFTIVNAKRAQSGLKPLIRDSGLDKTAQERADDMVNRNYRSHFDPVTGKNLVQIIPTNPQCISASENISWNGENNAIVVKGWLGSKSHHDAMLRVDYTLTGVAVNGNVVVQHFCK